MRFLVGNAKNNFAVLDRQLHERDTIEAVRRFVADPQAPVLLVERVSLKGIILMHNNKKIFFYFLSFQFMRL